MKHYLRYYLITLLLILKSGFTFCQNFETSDGDHKKLIQYNIDNWDIDDGLPTNSLNDIIQTNDGYIWISSYNGLIRYDGINFKVFDKSNTHVFKENGIGLLAVDSKGVLWMTTQNSGLVSFHEGIFKSYGPDVGIEHLVPVILIDSNDRIWSMSIEKGWFVFDGKEFNFLNPGDDIGNQELQAIAEDHSGKIWFGTVESGLFVYNKQTFISFTKENGLISNRIRSIAVDKKGIIWIASDKGLQIFKDNRFETLNVMKDIIINSIISDSNGNLWFATTKGLFFRNDKTGIFENLNTDNGLINNYINNILIDIEDNIWIVYYKAGFSRLNSNKFISYTEQKGLPGTLVNSVCEIESNKFLLAFDDGQICLIENGTIKPYKFIKGLTGERIRHLYKDSKKNLWISTYSGLLKIEPSGNEVWYNTETGFPGKYIRMVFEDSRKNIWVGTRNTGLIKINKDGTYTCYDKSKGLQSSIIMSIDEDRDGNLIIGTSKGGLHLLSSDGNIEHFSVDNGLSGDIVFNTYCDSDNNIWICTNGGLCCYINNRIYKLKQNTFNIYPFDILEDDQEDFWMSTVNGVVKVNRSCLLEQITTKRDSCSFKVYGKFDGIKQPECNATASGLKAENGTLWFPTLDGVTTVDPNNIKYNDHVPPVFIEEIFIDNIPVLNRDTTIYIEPGRKRVTFNFMALSYNEPKKVKFKYKLVGFENEWSDPVSERTVSYTNLSPGSYTFMVIACNNDEVWNDQGAEVKFVVVPHFYQRDIFYFMAILSLIIFAYLIYRLRVKSLTQERKRLENIVKIRTEEVNKKNHEISSQNEELIRYKDHLEEMIKERTADLEIAKSNAEKADKLKTAFLENLSHEIRTPLNAIVGFSTMLEKEMNLSESSKRSIQNIYSGSSALTRIVDSIMQASQLQVGDIRFYETEFSVYDFLKQLYSEMNAFAQKKPNIKLRIFAEAVKDIMITCDQEKLYVILYNLIDNAIKFTEIGFVDFGANIENENQVLFFVKDTGIGIATENLEYIFDKFRKIETQKSVLYRGLGLGLNITKSLVNHLNGEITVQSFEGKGTEFQIRFSKFKINYKKSTTTKEKSTNLKMIDLKGKKILIAEDEQLNMDFLETVLAESGATIYKAQTGKECIEVFSSHQDIDLILMDIKMPLIDGLETTRIIRKKFPTQKVKIIAQSAYTMNYQKEKIQIPELDDIIAKPIDPRKLMYLIQKHLF